MALAGITVLASSGDTGAHDRSDPTCGRVRPDAHWPASSPWVLSVGASQLSAPAALSAPTSPFCKGNAVSPWLGVYVN